MKPEQQRLAIATHLGWTEIKQNPKTDLYYGTPPKDHSPPWDVLIPDYPNDLNVMHEAEKVLTEEQRRSMMAHLGYNFDMSEVEYWNFLHSTAAQRAEAFLRTLNLWKEN